MGVIWNKVWRDLAARENRARTWLVVFSTAVGVFALGLVFGMRQAVLVWLAADYQHAAPAHLTIWASPGDKTVVGAVQREPGLASVSGRSSLSIRWKVEGQTDWYDGILEARADYEAQYLEVVDLVDGYWPAHRTLAIERQASSHFGVPLGTIVTVEYDGRRRHVPVTGLVQVHNEFPPRFGGPNLFYATPESVTWLTGREGWNALDIRLAGYSYQAVKDTYERVGERLEQMGLSVSGYNSPGTGSHSMQGEVDVTLLILVVMGFLALALSAFLIANTMNAVLVQQVWQIGVMKTLGATFGRVACLYLAVALIYGGLALLAAVPAGAVAAHLIASWLLDMINVATGPFRLMPGVVGVQVGMGLATPLLAALLPVIASARITPHRAISSYGLGGGFGRGYLDRLVGTVRWLPRPLALSLRNTFRRKARIALTLCTLVSCGVMFMVTMSARSSLDRTIELQLQDFGDDVRVWFKRSYRSAQLAGLTESAPGVARAEVWFMQGVWLALGEEQEEWIYLWGLPPDSRIFSPRLAGGRWLDPLDDRAIVLNKKIAMEEGIRVGDEIVLKIRERETGWTVVGLIVNMGHAHRDCFVPFTTLSRELGAFDRGWHVRVQGEGHARADQRALVGKLRETYAAHNLEVNYMHSSDETREQSRSMFDLFTYLLLAMTLLAATVGSIGLMGTMSLGVVERRREIGVMRAIGASSPTVAGIFIGEGVMLGGLSWLLAVPFSYPAARLFSDAIGYPFMGAPLDFCYSLQGVGLWLLTVIALSALVSTWPALRATQISVHEALAYE